MRKIIVGVLLLFTWAFGSAISNVQITNVSDQSFSVSWISAASEAGHVNYGATVGLGATGSDQRLSQNWTRHYVTVEQLNPNTVYYFDVVSGLTTDSNSGSHFSVQTAPAGINPIFVRKYGQTYDSSWALASNVYYEMYLEDHDASGSVGKSQIRSGMSNAVNWVDGMAEWENGWQSVLDNFRTNDNQAFYSFSNSDHLVVNFFREDGSKTQLRIPLSVASQDVSLLLSSFPIIDDFEAATTNGWIADITSGLTATVTSNAYGNFALSLKNNSATNYYAGFASKYITGGQNLDWGQYNYLKVTLKNTGPIGSKVNFKLYQNNAATYSAAGAEIFNVTMNLVKSNVFKTMYIPLNNVILKKDSGAGTGIVAPYQIEQAGQVYPGVLMLGMSLAAATAAGPVSVVVDDVALITTMWPGAVDSNSDGIHDPTEFPFGINGGNILGDLDIDGLSNYVELVQGTSPLVSNGFPLIDGFEGHGFGWVAAGNITTANVATTDTSVVSNGSNSLLINGTAAGYYAGFASAWVSDEALNFDTSYKSIKFLLKNEGAIGDSIKIQLNEHDGDVWEFTQVLSDMNKWDYYTVVLASFNRTAFAGDGAMNFSPSGDVGGLDLIGLGANSRTATGAVRFYIDSIEASTVPTSNDTDGDGLPNAWEIANGLNPNDATGVNGANGSPAGDGFTNLDKYVNSLSPQTFYGFPVIDSFATANGWATNGNLSAAYTGLVSLTGTSALSDGYVGYFSKYVGNYLFDWSNYKYIQLTVQNYGQAGDKVQIQIVDNDSPTMAVLASGSDRYVMDLTLGANGSSTTYYIPYSALGFSSANVGDKIENFQSTAPSFPGISFVGFVVNSATPTGAVNVQLLNLTLTTNMPLTDADANMLPDAWETLYGISGATAAQADPDHDGLTNLMEYSAGTNPIISNATMVDSDSDGMPNNWETLYGLNPLVNDAGLDPDADGLTNVIEYRNATNPLVSNATLADTDGDLLPDVWELGYASNLATLKVSPADYNSNGISDYQEYMGGTNPVLMNSVQLYAGWNLITLGITGNLTISQIMASINAQTGVGNATEAYIYQSGTWRHYPGTDFGVSYGEGFFVYTTVAGIYNPQGQVPAAKTYNFNAGWSTLGKSIGSTYTAAEVVAELNASGLVIEQISRFRLGVWTAYDYTGAGTNFSLGKYSGYFVKLATPKTWTPVK